MESKRLAVFEAIKESIALTLWGFLGFESAAANADAVENPKKKRANCNICRYISSGGDLHLVHECYGRYRA